jgi:FMN phosphatase YigB (HAD superfamily)
MQTILFFDLDATLIENHFSRKAIGPLLEEIAELSHVSVEHLAQEMNVENKHRQKNDPDNVLTMDWEDIIATIAAKYGFSLSDSVDRRWQLMVNTVDIEILDDAPTMLKLLQNTQRKLVLATKGLSKYQNPILDVTGLGQFFDDMLTPDITGYLKTSAQYFDKYRQQEALFIQVGDHFYDDVICARRNGFHSIMRVPIDSLSVYDPFDRPQQLDDFLDEIPTYPVEGSEIRPDAVVVSLQEVPDVVRRIEANHNPG